MIKRFLFIVLIIFYSVCVQAIETDVESEVINSPGTARNEAVFKSHFPEIMNDSKDDYISPSDYIYNDDFTYTKVDPEHMPFFQQMRLRVTNKLYERQQKTREKEAKIQAGETVPSFWDKFKRNKKSVVNEESEYAKDNSDLTSTIDETINQEVLSEIENMASDDGSMSLSTGIREQVTQNQFILDSESVDFDHDAGTITAIGNPVLMIPAENTTITSDKMIYNEFSNTLKCIDNVVINKNGMPTTADYLEVNLNEETVLMDNVSVVSEAINIEAETSLQKDGLIILENGSIKSFGTGTYRLQSQPSTARMDVIFSDKFEKDLFFEKPSNKLSINVKDLYVEGMKAHDMIKAKDIDFYKGDKKVLHWPSVTMYTDKSHRYFEGSYPELGSLRKVGMFAGPGFAFRGPYGSVIKLIPFLNYKSKIGIGGDIRYRSAYNLTDVGYGSSENVFFFKGVQKLDENLFFQYAMNAYQNEWFMGSRMPKYSAEVYYHKPYMNKDFLAKDLDLIFTHRVSFGIMKDMDGNYNGENIYSHETTTTRLRYMAEVNQTFYKYENKEKDFTARAGLLLQGSSALYGTGDTQFVGRGGPTINTIFKNWSQTLTYFMTGYSDQSPLPRYDAYRYGGQSIAISEVLRLNKYISVGWFGYVSLTNDTYNNRLFQENTFMVSVGPEDIRLVLGYDIAREMTYFGINMALNGKGTNINYNKLVIKNPESIGQGTEDSEEQEVAFAQPKKQEPVLKNKKTVKPVLEYAQVIEIEDPVKERID